ncbi:hypothetical protein ACFTXJ_00540 [Streptomyces zhihengii]|uniref:hypothetical protein n=1 Tax=Streptomyces zhihengii TaxID=1818004 RepID=UPI00363ACFE1
MLDTVEGRLEVHAEQWDQLLASPVDPPDRAISRLYGLLRVLLLEPDSVVAETTEECLSPSPDPAEVTDALAYLTELAAKGGRVADRARQCQQLIMERAPE